MLTLTPRKLKKLALAAVARVKPVHEWDSEGCGLLMSSRTKGSSLAQALSKSTPEHSVKDLPP